MYKNFFILNIRFLFTRTNQNCAETLKNSKILWPRLWIAVYAVITVFIFTIFYLISLANRFTKFVANNQKRMKQQVLVVCSIKNKSLWRFYLKMVFLNTGKKTPIQLVSCEFSKDFLYKTSCFRKYKTLSWITLLFSTMALKKPKIWIWGRDSRAKFFT